MDGIQPDAKPQLRISLFLWGPCPLQARLALEEMPYMEESFEECRGMTIWLHMPGEQSIVATERRGALCLGWANFTCLTLTVTILVS